MWFLVIKQYLIDLEDCDTVLLYIIFISSKVCSFNVFIFEKIMCDTNSGIFTGHTENKSLCPHCSLASLDIAISLIPHVPFLKHERKH